MAVLRCALVEERGLRSVLRRPVGTAGRDQIQGVECDGADHVDRAVEQIGDGVGRADRRRTLQHDVARIEFLVHQVRREPDFFFAVDQSPDERGESRVLGQQRIVDVEGAVLGCVEDLRRQPGTPVVGDDDVGSCFGQRGFEGIVRLVRHVNGYTVLGRQICNRVRPHLFVDVFALRVCDCQHDLVIGVDQGLQGTVAPGLVSERSDSQRGSSWTSMGWGCGHTTAHQLRLSNQNC